MKTKLSLLAVLVTVISIQNAFAQNLPANALTNVTLHNADGSQTESATIVWRDGVVEATGNNVTIPFDAFTIDGGDSLHVYPGFINGYTTWGSPETPSNLARLDNPGDPPYHRAGIQPERKPSDLLEKDKNFEAALKNGFTTAALAVKGFMLPGQLEVFYLSEDHQKTSLLKEDIGLAASFRQAPGGWSNGAYPSTLMGVMAKFRQMMFDATALQQHMKYFTQNPEMPAPNRDKVLEAMFPLIDKRAPLFFEVDSKEDIERVFLLQDQFGFKVVIVSGKEAYAKSDELKRRNIPVLASFDFSDQPDWYKKDAEAAETDEKSEEEEEEKKSEDEITDEEKAYREKQLEAWKAEVSNIRKLLDDNVNIGFATVNMDLKDLSKKISLLLDEGAVSEDEILSLMTLQIGRAHV